MNKKNIVLALVGFVIGFHAGVTTSFKYVRERISELFEENEALVEGVKLADYASKYLYDDDVSVDEYNNTIAEQIAFIATIRGMNR